LFGFFLAFIVGIVIIGGIKGISRVTEKVVPFMGGIYSIAALVIIFINYEMLPSALTSIFTKAFTPEAGMGGILAGNAITKYLETNKRSQLQQYQKFWHDKFGKEFEKQRIARKILEKVDNKTIDMIFDTITPEIISEISNKDDFDFHATSIVKLLGMRKSLSAAQNIMSAEIKRMLTSYSHTKSSKV